MRFMDAKKRIVHFYDGDVYHNYLSIKIIFCHLASAMDLEFSPIKSNKHHEKTYCTFFGSAHYCCMLCR